MLIIKNVDIIVWKGGVLDVLGCIEYICILIQIIRQVRKEKNKLVIIWLDCVNVYGFMLYKFVQLVLEKYCVLVKIR